MNMNPNGKSRLKPRRMKSASFLVACLALGAVLSGQPLSRAADPAAADDYEPLLAGQESVMTATIFSPQGSKRIGTGHQRVEAAALRNGKSYFRCHTWTEGWPQNLDINEMLRKEDKAIYHLDDQPNAVEAIALVLPLKVGSTWSSKTSNGTMNGTVVEMQDLTVNGKTYPKCFHIRTVAADGAFTEDFWDAPGIGTVKSDTIFKGGARVLLELNSFTPGK